MTSPAEPAYSSTAEARRILDYLLTQFDPVSLPPQAAKGASNATVTFKAARDAPYFPIPFKETETAAALKAVEGAVAALLSDLKDASGDKTKARHITVDLEKTTAFLCQAYLATVGGLGKLDPDVKALLKGEFGLRYGTEEVIGN